MIKKAVLLENHNVRNRTARSTVAVMGSLFSHLRDVPDFQYRPWDQLFIVSDFKLDVDSPCEKPTRSALYKRSDRLQYLQAHSKYRFYDNVIIRMVETCCGWEKGELREALEYSITNHMKKSLLTWNKESVDDSVIFEYLYELSGGEINLRRRKESLTDSRSSIRIGMNLTKRILTTPPHYRQGRQKKGFTNYKKNNNGRFQN